MAEINLATRSTSTPASEISSADFANDDRGGYSAETESKALADILRKSPAAALLGIPEESQSTEETDDEAPEASSEEQQAQETDGESEKNDDDEGSKDSDEANADTDDTSTPNTDLPSEEDIDWEYKVPVTVDGKTEYKTLDEIRKGFATDQHLSQKGRELGELRKQVDSERTEKLNEIVQIGIALNEQWVASEQMYVEQYNKVNADMEAARESGDTYNVRELRDARDAIQEKYWAIRNKREATVKEVSGKIEQNQRDTLAINLRQYNEKIKDFIPDYTDKTAKAVREFAIKEGIPEALLSSVYEPAIVKFINDYRKLKTAKESGEVKRKVVTATKAIPLKKGQPAEVKQRAAQTSLRNQVFSGNASQADQNNFLKSISSISRKL